MSPRLSMRKIVDSLATASDQIEFYLNRETGEIIELLKDENQEWDWSKPEINSGELENWQKEMRLLEEEVKCTDKYIPLPNKYDIFEYRIIEDFCLSYPDEKISRILCRKIRGSGAFRRFKDAIFDFEIEDKWYEFKENAFREMAISWLAENKIDYIDDPEE